MSAIVIVLGLLTTGFGLLALVSPQRLGRLTKSLQTPFGLYFGASFRVLLGLSLWFAAPTSRAPDVLRVLAVVFVVSGLLRLVLGLELFRKLLDWWMSREALIRAWGSIATTFGLLLIYWFAT